MVQKLKDGYDMVQASRFMKGGIHRYTPLLRLIAIHAIFIPLMAFGSGYWFTDPTNGFKGFSRRYLLDERMQVFRNIFKKFNMQFYLNYRPHRLGYKVLEIPASRIYAEDGTLVTKIHGLQTHLVMMLELIRTVTGAYNPR